MNHNLFLKADVSPLYGVQKTPLHFKKLAFVSRIRHMSIVLALLLFNSLLAALCLCGAVV